MSISRVLFAIRDPEARSQPGLAKAIQVARALDASLELFHAITDSVFIELARHDENAVDRLRERIEGEVRIPLTRLCEVARGHGVDATHCVEWDYPPHEAIVRRAVDSGVELIIAECHRGARTRPWLIHLTDWELLRTSPLPVLLLKNGKPYYRPLVLAAVDPAHAHAKPADLDARIATAATRLANGLRGEMHLLHANAPSIVGTSVEAAAKRATTRWSTPSYEELLRQERDEFEKFRAAQKVPRRRAHVVEDGPAAAIPRLAGELGAGIVVMGALSRSGLQRVIIGNTAERVLAALPCDVLVVKPPGSAARIATQSRGIHVVAADSALMP
jgi:universal stress protein E